MTCRGCAGSVTGLAPVCRGCHFVHAVPDRMGTESVRVRQAQRAGRIIPRTATPAEVAIYYTVLGYRRMEGVNA